jgi:esterase/lipase superfamily enzyme
VKEEYFKWHSYYLNREFEMLVFGHTGYPVILFPTEKGRFYDNKDFGLIGSAVELIERGRIKIYCPDSFDSHSWYNYSVNPSERVLTEIAYEDTIISDVLGYINHDTGLEKAAAAGCSFGAYHAANLAFRHPDLISHLFCMGGTFNIKRFIFGYYDDNCYFNNPPDYLPNLNDPWYLDRIRQMGIVLGTGDHDINMNENISLSELLKQKNINHRLDIRNGAGHSWQWWKEMFPQYLFQING